jgi:hypothetical protein
MRERPPGRGALKAISLETELYPTLETKTTKNGAERRDSKKMDLISIETSYIFKGGL